MAGNQAEVLELVGRQVRSAVPTRVLFRERGETKLDLVVDRARQRCEPKSLLDDLGTLADGRATAVMRG